MFQFCLLNYWSKRTAILKLRNASTPPILKSSVRWRFAWRQIVQLEHLDGLLIFPSGYVVRVLSPDAGIE